MKCPICAEETIGEKVERWGPEFAHSRCVKAYSLGGCDARQEARAAASRTSLEAVPDGWKLVPVEPTDEMVAAGWEKFTVKKCYSAMLSAAPAQPAQQPGYCRKIGGCECAPEAMEGCISFRRYPAQPAQQLPPVVASAPGHIWLDLGFDPKEEAVHFSNLTDVTWSEDNATGDGIKYVRSDLAGVNQPAQQERQPMTDADIVSCIEEAGFRTWTSAFFRLARLVERHHGIRKD